MGDSAAMRQATLQAAEMRKRRAEDAAAQPSTSAAQGRLARVVEIVDTNRLRVDVDGSIVPATIDRSLGAVRVGDTVDVIHQGGGFRVVRIVTWHEPEQVSTDVSMPPKPSVSVSVPSAASGTAPGPSTLGYGLAGFPLDVNTSYGSAVINARLNTLAGALDTILVWEGQNRGRWGNVAGTVTDLQSKVNGLRTGLGQAASGLGATVDYAADVGDSAAGAAASTADAAVEAGAARRVQNASVSEMPENIDRAGYEAWDLTTQAQATRILAWRTRALHDLRTAVNQARAYRGMSPMPAFPATPDVTMDDLSWSTAATRIGSVDSWSTSRATELVNAINVFRTNEALGAAAISGGSTAWAGGTYEAARPQLIVSLRNFRIRVRELTDALNEPINILNGKT